MSDVCLIEILHLNSLHGGTCDMVSVNGRCSTDKNFPQQSRLHSWHPHKHTDKLLSYFLFSSLQVRSIVTQSVIFLQMHVMMGVGGCLGGVGGVEGVFTPNTGM